MRWISSPAREKPVHHRPRILGGLAQPDGCDEGPLSRRQLDDGLEAGEAIAVPLGLQSGEPGAPRRRPGGPHGRLVEGPAEEPAATFRDPGLPRELPRGHPHAVEPGELPELAKRGEPRDVANLRQEDRAHRGPDARDRPEERVGGEPLD